MAQPIHGISEKQISQSLLDLIENQASSLQTGYELNPAIVTNSTNGAVEIKVGSGADSDKVLIIENTAGAEVASIDGEGNIEGNSFNGFQGFGTLAADLLTKLPKGTYTGTASDLEASILAISTGVQGVAITPTSTPTGTGVASWLVAESGTYTNFGGVILPVNHIGFIIRSASNVYSITSTELDLTGYVSKNEIQELGRSLLNEQINYIDPNSFTGLINFPVSNRLFIPSQNIIKKGYLLSFSVPLINAQIGRTVRFQVLEKIGINDFKLKFQTADILAETNGTFTYNLPNAFKVLAGYYIGAIVTTANTSNSMGFHATGGNNPVGWGGWNKSNPTIILDTSYTAAQEAGSRGFPIYATFSEELIVKSDKANKPNGFVPKNSNNRVPIETIFEYDYLAGKKMVWVGTSIPAGGGDLNYPKTVGKMLNCIVDNQAVGSSGIVWDGTRGLTLSATIAELTSTFGGAFAPQSYENKIIGKQADYLVFDHIYNDTQFITNNTGTINSTDKTTIYGAFNFVIQAALTDRPTLKLIFITPPNRYEGSGINGNNTISIIDQGRNIIFNLAKKYNALVVDLATLCNINNINYTQYKSDGVHPLDSDRERLAYIIARNIKNIG